ncbi:hypothetical protein [Flavobacterium sp.]|uniref:hypothetical protein n=1 Tax=Flavobacterium sp. TaxID=239 RepID=UPI00262F1901|nr:hypothetical protein [Flavobacterium sp.]
MKQLKKIGLLLLVTLSFISCNNDDGSPGKQVPSSETFKNLFEAKLISMKQAAIFDASSTYTFTSAKGVKLTINGGCLRKAGVPVTGEVKLEFIEIFDRGDMLTSNKATMGKTAAGEDRLLVSGGEFFIEATQNGVVLTSDCFMQLEVPTALSGGTDPAMLPFAGTPNEDGDIAWEQVTGVDFSIQTNPTNGDPSYFAFFQDFGWFNCDRFYDYSGPKTTITSLVPAGYSGPNSFVFLASKDFPNSLGKSYGEFPVGMECYLIFVTEKDGKFRYAIKPSTPLTENHQVTFTLAETIVGTQESLTAALNALP